MDASYLAKLNPHQRQAATFDPAHPLLIIAGAGTGKTNTLAHRVAHLVASGINPGRILLLTFTRRASAEMLRRVDGIIQQAQLGTEATTSRIWGGTFHSMANRLLRIYCQAIGLGEAFTVMDRSDSEDLMNIVRSELELDRGDARFPRKATCLSIYSRCVNAQEPLETALKVHFPWCSQYPDQLKALFKTFTARKHEQNILDYDDLLLYWYHLVQNEAIAQQVASRFDAVLVDEYQDTNILQAGILEKLCPGGKGLTVVGDDAQSIYSFRAATVHNILDFSKTYAQAEVIKLEQNYRSVQPILDAANAVIGLSSMGYRKELSAVRGAGQKPTLVHLVDEDQQSRYIVERVLHHLEAGIPLKKQAVLFRSLHHSDALEVELMRRNIPFVKFGGLKFLEAAHVKDLLSFLRLAENTRDSTSAFRILQLLDGIGPASARKAIEHLCAALWDLHAWLNFAPPAAAKRQWGPFVELMLALAKGKIPLQQQIAEARKFYTPILEKRYDQSPMRVRDLHQMEQISSNFRDRSELLAELTLDPPNSTQDLAGPPLLDEDYLILSTIHSAKGCEWDAVYVLHAADGNIPSDMATGSDELIEEERRLFYVSLTRAKDFLYVCFPSFYQYHKPAKGYSLAQLTRFLPPDLLPHFEQVSLKADGQPDAPANLPANAAANVRSKIAGMWD
jgi:ATP-dependent DNA helicase UvrD/PcrA